MIHPRTFTVAFWMLAFICSIAEAAWDCTPFGPIDLGNGLSLKQRVHPEEGWFTMQLSYEGYTWIGIGPSEDGGMIGTDAVIGRTDIPSDPSASGERRNPAKYRMTSEDEEGAGVRPMDDDRQTLEDASVEVNETHTILTFTKYLDEFDELSVPLDDAVTWVFAAGSDEV